MPEIFDFSPAHPRFLAVVGRGDDIDAGIGLRVAEIIADIRRRGGDALLEYINKFDAPTQSLAAVRVTPHELAAAAETVGDDFLAAISRAADNIRRFHLPQIRKSYSVESDGISLAKRVLPISRAGVYCPAGTAPLFSSMLMNVIPAQLAGVREIAVAVPPRRDGSLDPHMLATAAFLGLDEIHKMGGAHAVAAFAYGTGPGGPVTRVDKIVGPGNAYVASAKRQVFGAVGIDSIAGPSEVVVIADKTANPEFVAADLLSQVEHGSGFEAGVLLTDSREIAQRVQSELRRMTATLERADAIRRSLDNYGALFVCRSLAEAVDAANVIAPEHLEIQTADPRALLPGILNAGAVFLGAWSSEPVGDYYAGTNHVLPTNGSARFSSSLGVADFQKDMSVVEYGEQALKSAAPAITLMARTESLTAHANAVAVRCRE